MKLGTQTHFGANSRSEPRKMTIMIPRRRRETWEGVTVATWCTKWMCRMWGGLGPHTLIFPASLSLPPMRGAAKVVHRQFSNMTRFTPESPILSTLQFCRQLVSAVFGMLACGHQKKIVADFLIHELKGEFFTLMICFLSRLMLANSRWW